jgi:hypothetical protein
VLYQVCLLISVTEVWIVYLFICNLLKETVEKSHCISFYRNNNIF